MAFPVPSGDITHAQRRRKRAVSTGCLAKSFVLFPQKEKEKKEKETEKKEKEAKRQSFSQDDNITVTMKKKKKERERKTNFKEIAIWLVQRTL